MIKAGRSQTTRPKTTAEIAKILAIQDKGSASIQVRYKIRTLMHGCVGQNSDLDWDIESPKIQTVFRKF